MPGSPPHTPSSSADEVRRTLDQVTRRERGRLIAGLVRLLGAQQVALAEDVAQEAVLKALASWPYKGLPDNPGGWLARVAQRCAIDRLRREQREVALETPSADAGVQGVNELASRIDDPQLRLMLLCCDDVLSAQDRVGLTLRLVAGFTAREIAQVLLVSEVSLAQRLARAKRRLHTHDGLADAPRGARAIEARLPSVRKTLYLMFSLGYSPRSGATLIRSDVALEAVRLAEGLLACTSDSASGADTAALTALICLQASRLNARADAEGRPIRLQDQDRSRWDRPLMARGLTLLAGAARQTHTLSPYHLEAAIAAEHATAATWETCDWLRIRRHYAALEAATGSPVVTINSCVAQAMAGDSDAALTRIQALADLHPLQTYAPFHFAVAEIARLAERREVVIAAYRRALACPTSTPVAQTLSARLSDSLERA
ncbi:MAG: sigma-70 family RNA polymerase sigma factor [Pseudomonadota bacterium]